MPKWPETVVLDVVTVGSLNHGTRPADLTCDGTIGFDDLNVLLTAWGACVPPDPCTGDISGDGHVGFADLVELLNAWSVSQKL